VTERPTLEQDEDTTFLWWCSDPKLEILGAAGLGLFVVVAIVGAFLVLMR
jgi:hypothetical protein